MALRRVDQLRYSEIVTDFFCGLRGGLMLSPIEEAQVEGWRAREIPAELVCRAIQDRWDEHLARAPGRAPPRRLAAYGPSVEAAVRAARERAVGARAAATGEGTEGP